MNELKTLQIINELCKVKLEKTIDKHCSYDAENSNHIAEIKNRRTYYSIKIIKFYYNLKEEMSSFTFVFN